MDTLEEEKCRLQTKTTELQQELGDAKYALTNSQSEFAATQTYSQDIANQLAKRDEVYTLSCCAMSFSCDATGRASFVCV